MEEDKKEVVEVQSTVNANPTEEPKKERKGLCIASMVLGIIALVFFCIWYVSIPCAILAIIFGILGLKTATRGMAIAGLVTGSIGLAISVIVIVFIIIGVTAGLSDALDKTDFNTYNNKNYRNSNWYDYD